MPLLFAYGINKFSHDMAQIEQMNTETDRWVFMERPSDMINVKC